MDSLNLIIGIIICFIWISVSLTAPVLNSQTNDLTADYGTVSDYRENGNGDDMADADGETQESEKIFDIVPTYMKELYESISKTHNTNLLHNGDSVRSYVDEGSEEEESKYNRYIFKLTDIDSRDEKVTKAELHLFKQYNPKFNFKKSFVQVNLVDIHNDRIVCSQKLSVNANGWVTLPITKLVKRWVRKPGRNKGIEITFSRVNTNGGKIQFATKNTFRRQPILVVFTKSSKGIDLASILNIKSNAKVLHSNLDNNNKRIKRSNEVEQNVEEKVDIGCQLAPLTVYLMDMGIGKKLISPVSLDINQCIGSCKPKMDVQTSNHGYFQIMDYLNRRSSNLPCCAPSSFKNGIILTSDASKFDSQHVRIMNLENLIATSCSCL